MARCCAPQRVPQPPEPLARTGSTGRRAAPRNGAVGGQNWPVSPAVHRAQRTLASGWPERPAISAAPCPLRAAPWCPREPVSPALRGPLSLPATDSTGRRNDLVSGEKKSTIVLKMITLDAQNAAQPGGARRRVRVCALTLESGQNWPARWPEGPAAKIVLRSRSSPDQDHLRCPRSFGQDHLSAQDRLLAGESRSRQCRRPWSPKIAGRRMITSEWRSRPR